MTKQNRRDFIKTAAYAGGMTVMLGQTGCKSITGDHGKPGASMAGFRAEPLDRIRVGIIGIGTRGTSFVRRLSAIDSVDINALCDLHPDRVAREAKLLLEKGKPAPASYTGSEEVWRKLCESTDIDVVYIITPWTLHAGMAVWAMECGKHAMVEVPAAMTVEDCWRMVHTAEATRRHCMILENCCYGFNEMLALNLCRQGVLGELVHAEAAYIHYSGKPLLNGNPSGDRRGEWQLPWYKDHTGNAYPTHGLGPVCQYLDINRGDRMDALSSMSSAPFSRSSYKMGDINTSIIRTRRGRTILLQFNTANPRPYTRINMISGTGGILADYPLRVALEPNVNDWMNEQQLQALKAKYIHPMWEKYQALAEKMGGHGGMDFMMDLRVCHCLQHGLPLDMDVYDTALWSSIVELSERSVLRGGAAVEVPDFTRGGWESTPPLGIVTV